LFIFYVCRSVIKWIPDTLFSCAQIRIQIVCILHLISMRCFHSIGRSNLGDLPVGDFSNVEHLKEVMDNGQVGEDQAQDGICCARYAGA
jgi:hypothetical protein